ncbi:DNA-dependent metalloprotease WSS1 [Choanephora cucurbitarum]|uniref:DNA-dependent metalloprotease WSS1 n=1 Tax=Choanephora cucurbitarum TaxID=101091 RepID=A0A1C7N2F0_9FUNG|nr:DNA-dependent metalloprotease WSS1 [Choanephora cucurbitarum]
MNKNEPIGDYQVLKRKPRSAEALELLKKVASQVKPILIKHGWKITTLYEFFPQNPNLLGINVNKGWQIKLRLRPQHDDTQFLEYHDILGTLLHEIVHIVRGPHDEMFYKKLEELWQETESLTASGYTGEGFYSQGQRLSTASSVPRYLSNQAAAAAAEKRLNMPTWMKPSGGRRLGSSSNSGSKLFKQLTPRELAARAAQKRLEDNVWCGGNVDTTCLSPASEKRKLDDVEKSVPTNPSAQPNPPQKRSRTIIDLTADDQQKEEKGWSCPSCTYSNDPIVLSCIICLQERPCTPAAKSTWTCPKCTLENDPQWLACNACAFVQLK